MSFVGEDESHITIDGYSQVLWTPFSGTEGVVSLVGEVKVMAKEITRELSVGIPTVGVDQVHSMKFAQTKPDDIAAIYAAIRLSKSMIVGAQNTSIIEGPSGRAVYAKLGLEMAFTNKADSFITAEVTKPGQPISSLSSFVVATS